MQTVQNLGLDEDWKRIIMGGAVSSAVSFNSLAGTQLESKALCGLLKKKLSNTRNLYMDVFH